jgi:hypothetical protein
LFSSSFSSRYCKFNPDEHELGKVRDTINLLEQRNKCKQAIPRLGWPNVASSPAQVINGLTVPQLVLRQFENQTDPVPIREKFDRLWEPHARIARNSGRVDVLRKPVLAGHIDIRPRCGLGMGV